MRETHHCTIIDRIIASSPIAPSLFVIIVRHILPILENNYLFLNHSAQTHTHLSQADEADSSSTEITDRKWLTDAFKWPREDKISSYAGNTFDESLSDYDTRSSFRLLQKKRRTYIRKIYRLIWLNNMLTKFISSFHQSFLGLGCRLIWLNNMLTKFMTVETFTFKTIGLSPSTFDVDRMINK